MQLVRSIITVSSFTVLSRILGFVRDILIASILGAGPVADAFFVAFRFPNFFRRLFAEGAFNAAFVPTFSRLLVRESQSAACLCASQIYSMLTFILIALVVFVEITIPWLMYVIAPGFSETPERFEMTVYFTRITFPYILLISIAALFTGILNSLHRFAVGAAAPVILNITMIFALVFFATQLPTPGHAIAWAVTLAGIGQLAWVRFETRRSCIQIQLNFPRLTEPVRRLMSLMLPASLAAGVVQVNMLIGTIFLSYLPAGAISYIVYADRLIQLPLSLVGVAISTALLPALSQQLELGKKVDARQTQNRSLEFSFFLIFPATFALFFLAEPMICTLFERGKFTRTETIATAQCLAAFSIGLPAYVMVKVFATTFFAHHNTKIPLHAAVLAVIANVILNFILFFPLGYVGIALATALASWVNAGWLIYQLANSKLLLPDRRLYQRLPRFLASCLVMVAVVSACSYFFAIMEQTSELSRFLSLIGLILIGFAAYVFGAYLMQALDFREIKENLRLRVEVE
ncbi:MAG: murein biosynthesis integral membrane protein MurJ [Pseudomonadota bacterium]